jgi:choline dehydrogenase-like flavoprotein
VIGVPGLRVMDASLLPTTVRGNIHLTVLMVAERLASRLIAEYSQMDEVGAAIGEEVDSNLRARL